MSDVKAQGTRLKVWSSVGRSFAFARQNYMPILRNISALTAILIALVAWNLYAAPPVTATDIENNTAASWDYMSHFYLFAILCAIPMLSMLVAIYRSYYEGPGAVGFYFRFGGSEIRLVGAWLLMAAVMLILVLAVALVLIVLLIGVIFYGAQTGIDLDQLAQAMQHGSAEGVRPSFLLLLVGVYAIALMVMIWAVLWASMRFVTLMPDVVRSGQIRVGANWSSTKGHAWRILLIVLAYLLVAAIPYYILVGILSVVLPGAFGDYFLLVLGQPGEEPTAPNLTAAVVVAAISQLTYLFLWIWSGALYCQIRDALVSDTGAVDAPPTVA